MDRLRPNRRETPNREAGRHGLRPLGMVLHTTAGSFEAATTWFSEAESGVSAHYLVGLDGRLAQFVAETDTAKHAGRVLQPTAELAKRVGEEGEDGVNRITIGIEFEDGGDPLGVERPDAQYEIGARLIAEIAARWGIPLDREHVVAHREIFAAKACPGNLDLERLLTEASEFAGAGGPPSLACLLPVRDGAGDIAGYLESVAALGAFVVALDDGSGDETARLLADSPLVETVLRNPPRADFAGWDDNANRRRLLEAAMRLRADWVLFLDVDERIDGDDARALREFIGSDALPGIAYGLELHRQWERQVVSEPTHVYRLFSPGTEPELRAGLLHFNPVPAQIPRSAWLPTTIRARHLDSPRRLQLRREKYRQADPEGRHAQLSAEMLSPPQGPLREWAPRPPGLAVLAPSRSRSDPGGGGRAPEADHGASATPVAGSSGPQLVCLLAARNCAGDLPAYLAAARPFVDAIVALDDGSTDDTASLLEASDAVRRVLRNPPRPSYAGWDDARNRQQLLEAAIELGARWVLFLDADERIDADDFAALRLFVERDAVRGSAYGFRVHRMVGDGGDYDRAGLWVYRLFAAEVGQRLPKVRLHLVPVPVSIPRSRWQKTTVRIQHLAGVDEGRRRDRLLKYEQADPEMRWQSEYQRSILELGRLRPWQRRPPHLPVLADPAQSGLALDLEELDLDAPLLSAIMIARDDAETIERSVRAVVEQECSWSFETIVVVSGSPRTAEVVRRLFDEEVTLVELAEPALPGKARNAGLARARGEYVSFPGSHVELAPGSLEHRIRAHEAGWAMVTGSIFNANKTPAGWASYFLDHSSALPGRPSAELAGAPAHCSYVREFLLEVGGFPEHVRAGEDTIVNEALWRRGHRAYRERAIELAHRSPCSTPARLVRHHFARGRAFGRILRGDFESKRRRRSPGLLRFLRRYPGRRLASTSSRVADWGGEVRDEYARVRHLVVLGVAAAWVGTCFELALPRPKSAAPKQPRQRHRGEPTPPQTEDDLWQGSERAFAALVQKHD